MIRHKVQWLVAWGLVCLLAVPALAAEGDRPERAKVFDVRTGAVITSPDGEGGRDHERFRGRGRAVIKADGAILELGVLQQRQGDGTLTVTPDGDLKRRGKSRVFVGKGTATAEVDGVTTTYPVRIVVTLRGKGDRLRLAGKFVGRSGPTPATDVNVVPPSVLRGVIHGRPEKSAEPTPE
ncbi:MAG: hypothetical protein Kow00105_13410 [Phycisphaeraceae bacterium]